MTAATRARPWLAHHGPDQIRRCAHVGDVAVCRRCAVLYPTSLLVALTVLAFDPSEPMMLAAMWVLPAPMVIEWVGEHLGWIDYSSRRQVGMTLLGAIALGAAFAWHAESPLAPGALAPILAWATVAGSVAVICWYRNAPVEDEGWEQRHLDAEQAREERLARILGDVGAGSPKD